MNQSQVETVCRTLGLQIANVWNGWAMMPCPLAPWTHGSGHDSNPSFGIKINPKGRSGFHCFACKRKGNLGDLARTIGGYKGEMERYAAIAMDFDLMEAEAPIGDFESIHDNYIMEQQPLEEGIFAGMFVSALKSKAARAYLEKRSISLRTARVTGMLFDRQERRVVFPVRDRDNRLFGFTGRAVDEPGPGNPRIKDYYGLKKDMNLLGVNLADPSKPFIVVEGLFAYAHFVDIGMRAFANPVATMGARMSTWQRDMLVEYGRPVYLFYDPDKAGDIGIFGYDNANGQHVHGAADLLKIHVPTFVPSYESEDDDPDTLTQEQVLAMMAGAELFS